MSNTAVGAEIGAASVSDILKTVTIPPCPAVVMALLEESRQAEVDFQKITRLVSGDMSLAASVMKTANSPFFALRTKAQTVQQAATVLGLKNVINIVKGLALQRALSAPGISLESFWERSNYHAMISARLARRVRGINREDAYTYGLFHDCGIPILMQRFPNYKDTPSQASQSGRLLKEVENERHGTDHAAVGAMLARNWQLPALIVQAIRQHHDYEILTDLSSDVPGEVRALTAITLLADRLIAGFLATPDEAEWLAHGASALSYLGVDEDDLEDLRNEMTEELNAVRADQH